MWYHVAKINKGGGNAQIYFVCVAKWHVPQCFPAFSEDVDADPEQCSGERRRAGRAIRSPESSGERTEITDACGRLGCARLRTYLRGGI